LLTGTDFWTAQTLTHLIAQIAYEPIPAPSTRGANFGPDYDAWFLRCTSRDVEQRFATCTEAIVALQAALGLDGASTSQMSSNLVAAEVARSALPPLSGARTAMPSLSEEPGAIPATSGAGAALSKTSDALTSEPGSTGARGRWMSLALAA